MFYLICSSNYQLPHHQPPQPHPEKPHHHENQLIHPPHPEKPHQLLLGGVEAFATDELIVLNECIFRGDPS